MDFNDLNKRLARLYASLGQRYDDDIEKHIVQQTTTNDGRHFRHEVRFGASDAAERENKVMAAIGAVADLKDHLKRRSRGPRLVEDLINDSEVLSLIVDLHNKDKHGDPLSITHRSGRDPHIANVSQGLSPKKGQQKTSFSMRFDGVTSTLSELEGDFQIIIDADIVDGNGEKIMSLEVMLEQAMQQVEAFIDANDLSHPD
jgi:hypothetical protein